MKKVFTLLLIIALIIGCQQSVNVENDEKLIGEKMSMSDSDTSGRKKDGLFIHVSSGYDNPHKALMPLNMAMMMSEDKDVTVYLDIEAVKMVLKDSKDMAFGNFPNLKDLLKQLTSKKVPIMVCPMCLKNAGKSESDLITGIIMAHKDKFVNFTKGKITTLDY